ncbi:hypothetical protein [Exiguobacterium sp. s155]|uniref:hypothetical protein n=1 Tax=Exiguobacterium sp. s155 TaxID=2751286 RepID=UPI001BE64C35|nr:hypothetical protein [Exiguobacterium sp. s155]
MGHFKNEDISKFIQDRMTCKHERTRKEYLGGMQTGDRECEDCGMTFSPAEYKKMRAAE